MSDWAKAPFDQMISDLRKEAPVKCQSCECLYPNFRDGEQGQGWYMDCETKPDCYQDESASKESHEIKAESK